MLIEERGQSGNPERTMPRGGRLTASRLHFQSKVFRWRWQHSRSQQRLYDMIVRRGKQRPENACPNTDLTRILKGKGLRTCEKVVISAV